MAEDKRNGKNILSFDYVFPFFRWKAKQKNNTEQRDKDGNKDIKKKC
jgi:hypothetical protein